MEYVSGGSRLINDPTRIVPESLLGMMYINPLLGVLDFGNVVVRKDYQQLERVKLITGGGSGHEPAYAGFVGKGMMTAAVQGDLFTSPSAKLILQTIKETSLKESASGVLLIIRNSMGNRLNFGLAAERATNDGIKTRVLIVDDDCCVKEMSNEKRGLSGLILIYKIAGAMAEEEKLIDEIYSYCECVLKKMATVLVCLRPCLSPTIATCICMRNKSDNEFEIGSGLHGEPGIKRARLTTLKDVCKSLIEELTNPDSAHSLKFEENEPVIVMINNLGTLTKLEESLFVGEFVTQLLELKVVIKRLYCGTYYTSLDTSGLSVTIVKKSDAELEQYLDAPCQVSGWYTYYSSDITPDLQNNLKSTIPKFARKTPTLRGPKLTDRQSNVLLLVTQFACDALISCERQLNLMDAESDDGDTGTRLKKGAEAILRELTLKRLKTTHPFTYFEYISRLLEAVMAGAAGCTYSILFEAAATVFANLPENFEVGPELWLQALQSATEAIKKYTNASFGNRTLVDPLVACTLTAAETLKEAKWPLDAFGVAVTAAEEAAQKTRLPHKRHPDPGAHAVGIWMRAVYEGVKLRCTDSAI